MRRPMVAATLALFLCNVSLLYGQLNRGANIIANIAQDSTGWQKIGNNVTLINLSDITGPIPRLNWIGYIDKDTTNVRTEAEAEGNDLYATVFDSTSESMMIYDSGDNKWLSIGSPSSDNWITSSDDSVSVVSIPANTFIINVEIHVTQAFNSAIANISVGDIADNAGLVSAISVLTTGLKTLIFGGYRGFSSTARTLKAYASYTGTPTAGKAIVRIVWTRVRPQP